MEGEEDDDSEYDEFNPYLFMKQLPPYNEVLYKLYIWVGGCLAGCVCIHLACLLKIKILLPSYSCTSLLG